MDIRQLKQQARQCIAKPNFPASRLALIFIGTSVGVNLLTMILSLILQKPLASVSGISGLKTRSILLTLQLIPVLFYMICLPFWNLGYTRAALLTGRQEEATPKTLLSGFRLIFPAIRLFFLQFLLIFVFGGSLCVNLATFVYTFTPGFNVAMIHLEDIVLNSAAATDPAIMIRAVQVAWPLFVLLLLAIFAIIVPMLYRIRLVEFGLVDGHHKALINITRSNLMMKGNCLRMFRLDLSFWWYFLLQGLAVSLGAVSDLFPDSTVAYIIFYLLSFAAQILVAWKFLPYVQTTYALAYDAIVKENTPPEQEESSRQVEYFQ